MSGGSFNYLCYAELPDLLNRDWDIQSMADELAKLGYAKDAAKETMDLLLDLRSAVNRLETRKEHISDVWKALEWWHSGDWSEESFKEELEKWRDKSIPPKKGK